MGYPEIIPSFTPRAHYKFGDASLTTASDSSGNGFNLTFGGSVTSVAGLAANSTDGARQLGSNGYASASVMPVSGYPLSIELLYKPGNTGNGIRLFELGVYPNNVYIETGGGVGNVYVIGFTAASFWAVQIMGTPTLATTYHYVITIAANLAVTTYVNSVQMYTGTALAWPSPTVTTIGSSASSLYGGTIDEIQVYDRVLTLAEIRRHYSEFLASTGIKKPGSL